MADKEKIRDAFDAFQNEKFMDSEEILKQEIKQSINDHLKDKLKLKNDPIVSASDDE